MPSALPQWIWLSSSAASRLWAAVIGMEVAGKVQVDVDHRRDLRPSAAGGAAFGAEHRPHRGFAQRQHRATAGAVERVGQADRGRRLALARRRRIDRGDEDQLAARRLLPRARQDRSSPCTRPYGSTAAAGMFEPCGDLGDRLKGDGAGDIEIGGHRPFVAVRRCALPVAAAPFACAKCRARATVERSMLRSDRRRPC